MKKSHDSILLTNYMPSMSTTTCQARVTIEYEEVSRKEMGTFYQGKHLPQ